jgi:hypothetical protein
MRNPCKRTPTTGISASFLTDRFPFPYTIDDAVEWINLIKQQTPIINLAIEIDGRAVGGIGFEQGMIFTAKP